MFGEGDFHPAGVHDQFEAVTDHLGVESVEDVVGGVLAADLPNSAMQQLVEFGVAEHVAGVDCVIIPSRSCLSSTISSSVMFSAAFAAHKPSTTMRTSVISMASGSDTDRTRAPRFWIRSMRPWLVRSSSAARTAPRLAWNSSHRSASTMRWFGEKSPSRMAFRIRSATVIGSVVCSRFDAEVIDMGSPPWIVANFVTQSVAVQPRLVVGASRESTNVRPV